MSVLSDGDIRARIHSVNSPLGIDPINDEHVQPASIDLTLGNEWLFYPEPSTEWEPLDIDYAKEALTVPTTKSNYMLFPRELVLCTTEEYVEIPDDVVAIVNGKSSLARIGLLIHITAGFIDPGFKGKITLEMYNLSNRPILLRAGRKICQLSFLELSAPAERPYGHPELGSHYQDQRVVTPSRYNA